MMTESQFKDLLTELNQTDEHPQLEAKQGLGESVYETICALANEPGLDGGVVLLGVTRNEEDLFGGYEVCGIPSPDQVSADLASACASLFNAPIRPRISPVPIGDKIVIAIEVGELSGSEKPLYFKRQGLPKGAWRRVGSTDQRCVEEDLGIFYSQKEREPFDIHIFHHATLDDPDPDAIEHYRKLRANVNPDAEELRFSDSELLQALHAIRRDAETWRPTLTGLLLFGTRLALRRELPAMRVDYIRVAGKEWVSDPERRYETTVDMRGPLLNLVDRAQAAIVDDLPRGFDLPEGSTQAHTPSLPSKALREAIVNALMHRSYRIHQPTQIIRYSNRIEIINAGFSLKNEDQLGNPGSQLRNPNLAAVFHETNTAETKGTGIRVMREQMRTHGFSLPTFESDRANERFTARFLLHHFLTESDLIWLQSIPGEDLSDAQRYALIFTRESGAIDNPTLRQLTGGEVLETSMELRKLRDWGYLEKKRGGAATYYVPGPKFPPAEPSPVKSHNPSPDFSPKSHNPPRDLALQSHNLPGNLGSKIEALGGKPGLRIRPVILELCAWKPLKASELAKILGNRDETALRRDHLKPMVDTGDLELTHEEMLNHPDQAYRARLS
jgi:ATP-dependent DNA helicase RecG